MIIALPAGTVNIFIWRDNIDSGPGTRGSVSIYGFCCISATCDLLYTTRGLDKGRTNIDVFSETRAHYLVPR